MVTTGTHYGLVSIGINNRMTIGYDTIAQPGTLASNVAQGGVALAIALKTKDTNKKLWLHLLELLQFVGLRNRLFMG